MKLDPCKQLSRSLANAPPGYGPEALPAGPDELAVFWRHTDWRPPRDAVVDVRQAPPSRLQRYAVSTNVGDIKVIEGDSSNVSTAQTQQGTGYGLRMDEAMHPLAILAVGMYGRALPNQNGAPLRLVVPWKYGFKSIKSIVRISFVEKQPPTTWELANPGEYGFYSNVNPDVDHPRWSQKSERRIGELRRRPTLPFNGYGEQVAALYAGMDLTRNF